MRIPFRNMVRPWHPKISQAIQLSFDAGQGAIASTKIKAERLLFGNALTRTPESVAKMSLSPHAQQMGEKLLKQTMAQDKNFLGRASEQSVEALRDMDSSVISGLAQKQSNTYYRNYRLRNAGKDIPQEDAGMMDMASHLINSAKVKGKKALGIDNPADRPLSISEFMEEVAKTKRRGKEHAIPEVNETAKFYDQEVYRPMLQKLVDAKLLRASLLQDEDWVKRYVHQIWQAPIVSQSRVRFEGLVTEGMVHWRGKRLARYEKKISQYKEAQEYFEQAARTDSPGALKHDLPQGIKADGLRSVDPEKEAARYKSKVQKLTRSLKKYSKKSADVKGAAREYVDRIVLTPYGETPRSIMPESKNLKSKFEKVRNFRIPEHMLESFEEFLDNDIVRITEHYARTETTRLRMKEKFGSMDLKKEVRKIGEEYDALIGVVEKAKSETTDARELLDLTDDMARLYSRKKVDMETAQASIDRLNGVYKIPDDPYSVTQRVADGLMKTNVVTMLGGVTPSSFPDLVRNVARHGMRRTGRLLGAIFSDTDFAKMSANDLMVASGINEILHNSRFMELTSTGAAPRGTTGVERGINAASELFPLVSLIGPWNHSMKAFAAMGESHFLIEMARTLRKGGAVADADLARALNVGLSLDDLKAIGREPKIKTHPNGVLKIANSVEWSNQDLARRFNVAIRQAVEQSIVTPGVGTKPLWMSGTIGRILGQFRSFNLTAASAMTMSSLQFKDKAALNGLLLSITFGYMTYAFKQKLAGREISTDPGIMILEGIDRSGVTGWLMDANNIMERTTGYGLNTFSGGPGMSRYAPRARIDSLLGPSWGTTERIVDVARAVMGDVDKTAVSNFRRLFPYERIFYLRFLFDSLEDSLAEGLGVKE